MWEMYMINKNSLWYRWLALVTSFVVAFSAIYLGILAFGWDLLGLGLLIQNVSMFTRPLLYAIGVFGIISLVLLLLGLAQEDTRRW